MVDLRTPPLPSTRTQPPYRRSRGPPVALVILAAIGVAAVAFMAMTGGEGSPEEQPLSSGMSAPPPPPSTAAVDP